MAAALLLGSLELHPAGEQLRESTGSWVVHPQGPDCAGPRSVHVDSASSPVERHCPSCLHRLQNRGACLVAAPHLAPASAFAGAVRPASPAVRRGEHLALVARGPPSIPS